MAIMEALKTLMRRVPGRVWFAAGGCLLAALWVQQHDARIRQQAGLQQLRNETTTQVSALRRQAAEDMQQANVKNARALATLEQRRQEAERQKRELAAQLESLRKQAQIQAGEAATLPISEIVTRVAAQLGLRAEDLAAKDSRKGAKAQSKSQATNYELPEDRSSADIANNAISAPPDAQAADIAKGAISAPPIGAVVMPLTASGARKVEASLVALDACRAESDIQARQLSNCQARAEADEAAIEQLKGSVDSLNQAVAAKDKILARQQSEYKAELRAARGTFLGRLARLSEHVAIGVAVGVAIGAAVK